MTNTLTPQQAEEIIALYANKAGRRPATFYTAQKMLGIENPSTTTKIPTKKNYNNTAGNRIHKNEFINENEKFRYVRMKEIQEINTTQISADAHHLLLVLMVSPSSNALGAFQISINEMCAQTGGRSKEAITTALDELIQLKKVRYVNNCIYITDFHQNQKTHGNADNLKSVFKLYNNLNDNQKLPYIGEIEFQNMNMEQLISEFQKLTEAIKFMSIIDSGDTTIDLTKFDVYTSQQIENIYTQNKRHYGSTNEQNTLASFAPPVDVAETSGTEIESNDGDDLQPQLVKLDELVNDVNETKSKEYSNHELTYMIHDATGISIEKIYNTGLGDEFIQKVKTHPEGIDGGLKYLKNNKDYITSNHDAIVEEFQSTLGIDFAENNDVNEDIKSLIILNSYENFINQIKTKIK